MCYWEILYIKIIFNCFNNFCILAGDSSSHTFNITLMYLDYFVLLHALYLSHFFYLPSFFVFFHFENFCSIISLSQVFPLYHIVYYSSSNIFTIILKLINGFIFSFQIPVYKRGLTTITSFQLICYAVQYISYSSFPHSLN